MALRLQQPGVQPIGQFDGYDLEATAILGGEVGTLLALTLPSTDLAAKDADGSDGYAGAATKTRAAVTRTLADGARPLFLLDDGTSYYGTLFGSVVGATAGQVSTGGAVLGPHTATGSGKITCWDKPGLYAVTLDAVDTTASTGLVVGNNSLSAGDALYATSAGRLTPNSSVDFDTSGGCIVGRFVEFSTDGSLVTTPTHLVSALHSPSGSTAVQTEFTQAVFYWNPPVA